MSARALHRTSNVLWVLGAILVIGGWFVVDNAFTVLTPAAVITAAIATGLLAKRREREPTEFPRA